MSLSLLAVGGVLTAFAVSYLSNLRSSVEGAAALRLALALPVGVLSTVAAIHPESVFALRAIGMKTGSSLTAASKYPHGELAIADQTLVFGAQDATYWAYGSLAIALCLVIATWRSYRLARRGEAHSQGLVGWCLAAWTGLWVARFTAIPVMIGEIAEGAEGLNRVLHAVNAQADQYLIPQEAWIYAPTQWYLALLGLGAALFSLLSLLFKSRTMRREAKARIASPLWTALTAALLVMVAVFGAGEATLTMRSSLWLAALLMSVVSLSRLPQLAHQVSLIATLIILAGAH